MIWGRVEEGTPRTVRREMCVEEGTSQMCGYKLAIHTVNEGAGLLHLQPSGSFLSICPLNSHSWLFLSIIPDSQSRLDKAFYKCQESGAEEGNQARFLNSRSDFLNPSWLTSRFL